VPVLGVTSLGDGDQALTEATLWSLDFPSSSTRKPGTEGRPMTYEAVGAAARLARYSQKVQQQTEPQAVLR
jgi:hypothetical protein